MLTAGWLQAVQEASYLRATAPVLTLHGNLKAAAEDRSLAGCQTTAFVTNPTLGHRMWMSGGRRGGGGAAACRAFRVYMEEGA